jgi:uncharacterized protein YbjT (DUF2867 family)
MNIIVFGAHGVLGRAVCAELQRRGHRVQRAARRDADVAVDFRFDVSAATLRAAVRGADVVVNAVGILIERDDETWDTVHHVAVEALAAACEAERVARLVHVSALGVGTGIPGGYMASKLAGEQAIARHGVDYALVRPDLLMDDACATTRLFKRLAALPVIALPGLRDPGGSLLAPVRVEDVAECIARIAEHPKALRRPIELAGPERMSYRELLARLRAAQGLGRALWVPLPWWLLRLSSWLALAFPQKVISPDTVRMLRASSQARSETARWLDREPSALEGTAVDAPKEVASIA